MCNKIESNKFIVNLLFKSQHERFCHLKGSNALVSVSLIIT